MLGRKDIEVKGVLPPEAAVNPAIFFTEMKKRDFLFTEKEEVIQTI
jgi:hypothetical protein